jgi:hypothetical protein
VDLKSKRKVSDSTKSGNDTLPVFCEHNEEYSEFMKAGIFD